MIRSPNSNRSRAQACANVVKEALVRVAAKVVFASKNAADAIDDILHGERGQQDAEQPRHHDVAGLAEKAADPFGAARRSTKQQRATSATTPIRTAIATVSVPARPASRTVAVSAPGPASSGTASGRPRYCEHAPRSLPPPPGPRGAIEARAPFRPRREQEKPAGDAKRRDEMPSAVKNRSPANAVPIRIRPAIMLARQATLAAPRWADERSRPGKPARARWGRRRRIALRKAAMAKSRTGIAHQPHPRVSIRAPSRQATRL